MALAWLALLMSALLVLTGCGNGEKPVDGQHSDDSLISALTITNCEEGALEGGDSIQLETDAPNAIADKLIWTSSNDSATVDQNGFVTAWEPGKVAITVSYGSFSDRVLITVVERSGGSSSGGSSTTTRPNDPDKPTTTPSKPTVPSQDPDTPEPDKGDYDDFYGDYTPAKSYAEALNRSKEGKISGSITVPDQAPTISSYRPKSGGQYIRNNQPYYADSNTYVVVDAYGKEVFRVYRGGGYITLEEVSAYVYAFGDVPANYVSGKKTKPTSSIWGEYLRLNHSKFSGSTTKYPYEPELPDISGCGGDLTYYEIDIGTTGTDCDPGYAVRTYNNGSSITRGAARIVYARFDANKNNITDPNEKYVFYTYNHYNDFQEYLTYYGGWGEMFGNITGGGKLSSKTNCNPTPYVPTVPTALPSAARSVVFVDFRKVWDDVLLAA